MPQVFVYVRQEDYDKWKAIEKKSAWLHEALNTGTGLNALKAVQGRAKSVTSLVNKDFIEELDDVVKLSESRVEKFVPKPPDPNTGYPCCQKAKPCKHWEYDGMNSQWANTLTGKTREVV